MQNIIHIIFDYVFKWEMVLQSLFDDSACNQIYYEHMVFVQDNIKWSIKDLQQPGKGKTYR